MRRRWGLSREARGDGFDRNRLGFGGIRGAHGVGREKEGREERKKRTKRKKRGPIWGGAGLVMGLLGWAGLGWLAGFFFFF